MKEMGFFDLIDILKENKDKLRFRKIYGGYAKSYIDGIEILENKNKNVIVRIPFRYRIDKNFFNLNEFIDKFLNKEDIGKEIKFIEFIFSGNLIKEMDKYVYLVKFFDKILKVWGSLLRTFLRRDYIEKNRKIKIWEMNDFEVVKELL